MNRPNFTTASRDDICAYAMTLEMLNSNQAVLIQRQGEAIRQQDERLSALEELASNLKGTIEDLKYNLEQSKMMDQNLARIHYGTKSERMLNTGIQYFPADSMQTGVQFSFASQPQRSLRPLEKAVNRASW